MEKSRCSVLLPEKRKCDWKKPRYSVFKDGVPAAAAALDGKLVVPPASASAGWRTQHSPAQVHAPASVAAAAVSAPVLASANNQSYDGGVTWFILDSRRTSHPEHP